MAGAVSERWDEGGLRSPRAAGGSRGMGSETRTILASRMRGLPAHQTLPYATAASCAVRCPSPVCVLLWLCGDDNDCIFVPCPSLFADSFHVGASLSLSRMHQFFSASHIIPRACGRRLLSHAARMAHGPFIHSPSPFPHPSEPAAFCSALPSTLSRTSPFASERPLRRPMTVHCMFAFRVLLSSSRLHP